MLLKIFNHENLYNSLNQIYKIELIFIKFSFNYQRKVILKLKLR